MGVYDMVIGKEIVSAFNGPADNESFDRVSHVPTEQTPKPEKSKARKRLEEMYQLVRDFREKEKAINLSELFDEVTTNYPKDWLLTVELYELAQDDFVLKNRIFETLEQKKTLLKNVSHLIQNGMELIEKNNTLEISIQ
jgi:phenylalanine-4-hydroxylase